MFLRRFHALAPRLKAQILDMPAMSPTMTEGGIVQWAVQPGAAFTAGDVLLDIETDKAQISVEAQDDGVMAKILKENGVSGVPVGTPIAVLCEEDDDISSINFDALLSAQKQPSEAPKQQQQEPEQPKAAPAAPPKAPEHVELDQIWLPSVIRLAHTFGIDPKTVKGTGPQGRVLKGDVLAALDQIPREAPKTVSEAIKKLQHLDLSYEPNPAAAKAKPAKEAPKPLTVSVDISLDALLDAGLSLDLAIAKAERLAVRDSIVATKPRPSKLRSSALDKLVAPGPKGKVPYSHKVEVLSVRGKPLLVQASVEYMQNKDTEVKADVFIDRVQFYLNDGIDMLLV